MAGQRQDAESRLYGSGWGFPLTFVSDGKHPSGIKQSSGAENVRQSLSMLFQTQPGERIMREGYGCDMQSMVFANLSEVTQAALRSRVLESVARYEPRAQVLAVDMGEDVRQSGLLQITVSYRLSGQPDVQRLSGALDIGEGMSSFF
ncbi:GPW/gp25 family protein [Chromobacterium haemolyticum]|uniref:GPW/gp25 family protein n=1 Tax=Chromobacterium haemolyticum TaxID=394935 RepID=UPI00244C090E|nr:GPW/gp25 family protein [Chromobacterium haemolyticum]MDH0342425.1 GPW/gp25 family protein [Chromobacterium haemolyticum]